MIKLVCPLLHPLRDGLSNLTLGFQFYLLAEVGEAPFFLLLSGQDRLDALVLFSYGQEVQSHIEFEVWHSRAQTQSLLLKFTVAEVLIKGYDFLVSLEVRQVFLLWGPQDVAGQPFLKRVDEEILNYQLDLPA